jgi:hypothetical protein
LGSEGEGKPLARDHRLHRASEKLPNQFSGLHLFKNETKKGRERRREF